MSSDVARIEPAATPAPAVQSESAALISMIERAARDPSVDIAKMERLFEMQQRAVATHARASFLAALSDMQATLPAVARKGTGHNSARYARFEDVIETVKPKLAEHGFSLTFRTSHEGAAIRVVGVLGHRDGHQEETSLPLPADATGNKNNVQAWGSSISYGKRYVAMSLLGIATQDDDDGNKAGNGIITEDQIKELHALIKDARVDPAAVANHYAVGEFSDMTAKQFAHAKAGLIARKRKAGGQ